MKKGFQNIVYLLILLCLTSCGPSQKELEESLKKDMPKLLDQIITDKLNQQIAKQSYQQGIFQLASSECIFFTEAVQSLKDEIEKERDPKELKAGQVVSVGNYYDVVNLSYTVKTVSCKHYKSNDSKREAVINLELTRKLSISENVTAYKIFFFIPYQWGNMDENDRLIFLEKMVKMLPDQKYDYAYFTANAGDANESSEYDNITVYLDNDKHWKFKTLSVQTLKAHPQDWSAEYNPQNCIKYLNDQKLICHKNKWVRQSDFEDLKKKESGQYYYEQGVWRHLSNRILKTAVENAGKSHVINLDIIKELMTKYAQNSKADAAVREQAEKLIVNYSQQWITHFEKRYMTSIGGKTLSNSTKISETIHVYPLEPPALPSGQSVQTFCVGKGMSFGGMTFARYCNRENRLVIANTPEQLKFFETKIAPFFLKGGSFNGETNINELQNLMESFSQYKVTEPVISQCKEALGRIKTKQNADKELAATKMQERARELEKMRIALEKRNAEITRKKKELHDQFAARYPKSDDEIEEGFMAEAKKLYRVYVIGEEISIQVKGKMISGTYYGVRNNTIYINSTPISPIDVPDEYRIGLKINTVEAAQNKYVRQKMQNYKREQERYKAKLQKQFNKWLNNL